MADGKSEAPLDLSAFDTLDLPPPTSQPLMAPVPPRASALAPTSATTLAPAPPAGEQLPVSVDARLAPQPRAERLVEISKLGPDELAAAQASAAKSVND
jgi:hypothetical protein